MSSLQQANGDDHPDAAGKHLEDARSLLAANRFDGAAHLAGYVVECSLKSLVQVETGSAPRTHKYEDLAAYVTSALLVAGARTAKYVTPVVLGIPAASISGWSESLRYRSPSMAGNEASVWTEEAGAIYSETVAAMILDGMIQ